MKTKVTKKEIKRVLTTLDRTSIFKIAHLCGVDVSKRGDVFSFIQNNAHTNKIHRRAYQIAYYRNRDNHYSNHYGLVGLTISDTIKFAKHQDIKSPYCKVLIKGNNNYYWCSPNYGHSDYNKSIAFPITENTNKLATLINSVIYKQN